MEKFLKIRKDDPKTFDEAIKSQDVALWKEAIIDEMDTPIALMLRMILRHLVVNLLVANESSKENRSGTYQNHKTADCYDINSQSDYSSDGCEDNVLECKGVIICLYVDDILIFGTNQVQVDMPKEFLSSKFSMKDMGEADVILVSTPMDTSEKMMPNNGQAVSQLEYSRVIGCLMYAMTCTRPDIAFAMGKLSSLTYTGYPSILEGYTDASWISNTEDNSSTTLEAAGKEAEWLKNLLLKIPLWSKPMAPISIRCDSAATLAMTYS
ncbi:zinc finger, CCHC-type containing protein [Tanacetum coccineum]